MAQYNYPGQPVPYQIPQYQHAQSSSAFFSVPSAPAASTPQAPEKQRPTPAVSAQTASQAVRRLIALELREAGFSGTSSDVMQKFEWELVAFLQQLYEKGHEYANLSSRPSPSIPDLATSCLDVGITPSVLRGTQLKSTRKTRKRKRRGIVSTPALIEPESRHSSPELLDSDDESNLAQPAIPVTLRYQLQPHLPQLPPKHTYLRTPAVPPKKAALPSLEKKLKTATLVQNSLQNLLTSTEDSEEHADAELLGHIVNWQSSSYPRKRWKLQ